VSRFFQRLAATALACLPLAFGSPALADAPPPSTWAPLTPLPEKPGSPLFALAVSPADSQLVLAGTSTGTIYRSADGGATWRVARSGLGRGVLTLNFSPFKPGLVMAGTRGAGAWRSTDGGATWTQAPGLEKVSARAFGFARSLMAAGTDHGVFLARDSAWAPAGLNQLSVDALAVAAVSDPSRLLVGADSSSAGETLPLYQSDDGGTSWSPIGAALGGSLVVASLAAGPLPPQKDVRPLLLGTNAGLFVSVDNGTSWTPLTGGGALPATDYNQVAFVRDRYDRFYVASDGGATDLGGLWFTGDGGQHFTSLKAPGPVTALAVSNDDQPTLYVATFRPADHAFVIWTYKDNGGEPKGPYTGVPPLATGGQPGPGNRAGTPAWTQLLAGPEAPYLAVGVLSLAVLCLAVVAYVRRGRA